MPSDPLSLKKDYWETLIIQDEDLDFLYNHLLETETPLNSQELTSVLVQERIVREKNALKNMRSSQGAIYLPKNHYEVGQKITFPSNNWQVGIVKSIRAGSHPELAPFKVIEVQFSGEGIKEFASELEEHLLNDPIEVKLDDPLLNTDYVMKAFGDGLSQSLEEKLEKNSDLVRIAGRWFPRALLVDVSEGHLNLAEAVLDMAGGGPLTTLSLLEQIELPTDVNPKLTEFSMNLALQEDGRFDEVGPSGEVYWFLRRLEPDAVQNTPPYLRYNVSSYNQEEALPMLSLFESQVTDELEQNSLTNFPVDQITLCLIFPHWRAGTLPLSPRLEALFPTAYESPRIQFKFIDGDSGKVFPGWVVRPSRYVFGLREWYTSMGVIPGSLIHIRRGKNPGEVIVSLERKKTSREWIRTALVGTDGGIVFAMLKQIINCSYDERMAMMISDLSLLDKIWEPGGRGKQNLTQVIINMMRELAKLNPQGHVHAQELYAAVNLVRRCPPGPILSILSEQPWAIHLGDLYFRFEEESNEG